MPGNDSKKPATASSFTEGAVLVTAFEPFGGNSINASREAAMLLADEDRRVETLVLPVVRGDAERVLLRRLENGPPPAFVLALGEADAMPHVRLEKVALNWDDYRIPDNAGNQPRDAAILHDGPAAYFSTLPIARIAEEAKTTAPLPVVVSLTAGSFLCNHLAYVTSDYLHRHPVCPFGFVHIPAWRPAAGEGLLGSIVDTLHAVIREAFRAIALEQTTGTISDPL